MDTTKTAKRVRRNQIKVSIKVSSTSKTKVSSLIQGPRRPCDIFKRKTDTNRRRKFQKELN